ncbi:hypothetical protein JCGZ_21753 [Jatropha curcas]|uniref:TPX2 C-terminal domain-containing protein n=2 Tax=Jatropha curcas TaxID=180498 RepID=A0A067JBX4_JATCU|nr:hypothetical protein JCGZ_21753 [Jatropha curcas]
MATSNDEDKMGETRASDRGLEVSVSFGRFENDTLSWEKWSSFSQNKYMEEVEKCATPGSVAKKKAYFEAHYRKIAARKAEQLGQEKQMEHECLSLNDQNGGDPNGKSCGVDSEFYGSNIQISVEENRQEIKLDSELGTDHVDKPYEVATNIEGQGSSVERVEEELGCRLDGPTLNKPEEAVLGKEWETSSMEAQEMKELPKNLDEETKSIPLIKEENVKLDHRKESRKMSPMSKIREVTRIKKKPASPVAKSPKISTPKVPKTVPTSSTSATSRPSAKKVTGSSLSKSKNPPVGQSKRIAPKSLHMSISLDTPTSNSAASTSAPLATTRKSFIMERMKDKDIVKRAFKTFQNNFNQLKASAEERALEAKQVPAKGTEVKVSSSTTPRKENAGSYKAVSMDKITAKAAPSSFGLKSDETVEKKKEFSKKLGEKSNAKEAESTRLQAKSKEEKDTATRKLRRQSLNFKATPMPSFYRGQKVSKSPLDKEGSKTLGI